MKLAITLLKQKEYNIRYNLSNATKVISEAFEKDADVVLLPEYFNIGLRAKSNNILSEFATRTLNYAYCKPYYPILRNIFRYVAVQRGFVAKDMKTYLKPITEEITSYSKKYVVGSIPVKFNRHIFNTGFIINQNGDILFKQPKIHPYDYEVHLSDPYNKLNMTELKGFNTSILICWDPLEGELENAINKGTQLVLSPSLFPIHTSTLRYSHDRAVDLRKHIYFACSTLIPEDFPKIPGGAFIIGPDIDCIRHKEGFIIQNLDKNKLKKTDHKIKKIMLKYNDNPHFTGYRTLNEAFKKHEFSLKSIKQHEVTKE